MDEFDPFDTEAIMTQWDSWRKAIVEGHGSWPRDAFECLIDAFQEEIRALQKEKSDET